MEIFEIFLKNSIVWKGQKNSKWLKQKQLFCHFLNPRILRHSWKVENPKNCAKKWKSLHPNEMLHVHAVCPCRKPMPMLHVHAVCPCCKPMSMLNVHVACPFCISMQCVHAAALVNAACLSNENLRVHVVCPCCMSMMHVHNTSLWCMSMLHVPTICPCSLGPCCLSMLHVRAACPCFIFVQYVHAVYDYLWRVCNLTAFIHSLTGPVGQPFASHHEGPRFNPRGGVLMWNRDSPVSVVSLHWWPQHDWSLWPRLRLRPEPSLGRSADNVIIPLDLTQLFCPCFKLAADPPSGFTTDIVTCVEPAISLHSYTVSLVKWVNPLLPFMRDPGSITLGGTYVKLGFSC